MFQTIHIMSVVGGLQLLCLWIVPTNTYMVHSYAERMTDFDGSDLADRLKRSGPRSRRSRLWTQFDWPSRTEVTNWRDRRLGGGSLQGVARGGRQRVYNTEKVRLRTRHGNERQGKEKTAGPEKRYERTVNRHYSKQCLSFNNSLNVEIKRMCA